MLEKHTFDSKKNVKNVLNFKNVYFLIVERKNIYNRF
jgi:hypothetical protein